MGIRLLNHLVLGCIFVLAVAWEGSKNNDWHRREAELTGRLLRLFETNLTFARRYVTERFHSPAQARQFPCPKLAPSPTVPDSVHQLRPADIKVVAALGDSLTAGRGASGGIVGLLIDYRGLSWSIGGDDTYAQSQTLPNILKEYNPNLYGYSQNIGTLHQRFNAAVTGAKAGESLDQAKALVKRLKSNKKIDFEKDWKLITIFIGANDLCDWCEDLKEYSVERYTEHVQNMLDYLHQNVPRAFVNMVTVLNVEMAMELAQNVLCEAVHFFVCNCAANPKSEAEERKLISLREGYQKATHDLVASGRYDTKDDFTVVVQPFYLNTYPPKTESGKLDMSFFASDCFHYSRKGHNAAAEALWNNMVQPVGFKQLSWTPGELIDCPSEEYPFLFTAKNSVNYRGTNTTHQQ